MKEWFNLVETEGAILINGIIGGGFFFFDEDDKSNTTLEAFVEAFDKIKDRDEITIRINSEGGNVFQGLAIYNTIAAVREKVSVEILGLAGSIASVIALAGKSLEMREGSVLMLHNPSTFAVGGAEDMRKTADVLDKIRDQIVGIYTRNSSLTRDEAIDLMDEETWLSAEEAVEAGLADEVSDEEAVALAWELDRFRRVPDRVSAMAAQAGRLGRLRGQGPRQTFTEPATSATLVPDEPSTHSDGVPRSQEDAVKIADVLDYLKTASKGDREAILEEVGGSVISDRNQLAGQVEILKETNGKLTADIEARKTATHDSARAECLDKALEEGRILPKDKELWSSRYDRDPEFTAEIIATQPTAVDTKRHGSSIPGSSEKRSLTESEAVIADAFGFDDEARQQLAQGD